MTAACMAAASMLTAGCGSAGTKPGQDGRGTAQKSWDKEGQEDSMAEGSAVQESAEASNGAGESVQPAGPSISIFGDSISTFQGYNPVGYYAFFPENGDVADVADTWWQQVADDLELAIYANGSSSGSTVAGDSTGTEDPQCGCNELRTNGLSGPEGACPDTIVIYMGTNDVMQAVPLGDNDGTRPVEEGEVETFSDAYTLMLDKLQANYPQAELYCCTPLQMGNYGTETPYVEFVNGLQLTAKDYGAVIDRIAQSRGICVIDLQDCGVTVDNLHEMTSDGIHPTAAGMGCIAAAVEKEMRPWKWK